MSAALSCRGLTAGYAGVAVVRDLNFELSEGTVLAVLGPNGAGKTTVLLTIAGLLPRLGGAVTIDGDSLPSFRPNAASKAGVVLVPDDRALFTTLTVEENLRAAIPRRAAPYDDVADLFPALRRRWKLLAGELSYEQAYEQARVWEQLP